MKKIFAILLIFQCVLISAQGQTYENSPKEAKAVNRIGVQAGFNMAKNIYVADGATSFNDEMKFLPAFNVGFYTEKGKHDYFTTQFGLFYQRKGTSSTNSEYHAILDYIQVPLMLNVRMPIAGPVFMKLGLGTYAAYAFNGKIKDGDETIMDLFSFPKDKPEENKMLKPYDFGISFSGQIEYILPDKRTIEFSVKYDLGVTKISNNYSLIPELEPFDMGIKNNVLSFNLVYSFDLNKPLE